MSLQSEVKVNLKERVIKSLNYKNFTDYSDEEEKCFWLNKDVENIFYNFVNIDTNIRY